MDTLAKNRDRFTCLRIFTLTFCSLSFCSFYFHTLIHPHNFREILQRPSSKRCLWGFVNAAFDGAARREGFHAHPALSPSMHEATTSEGASEPSAGRMENGGDIIDGFALCPESVLQGESHACT